LIASDLKSLAFSSWSPRATKVRAARVSARLTTFRVGQVALLIIFLFAFGEWEWGSTICTCDFKVWHGAFFSMRAELWFPPSLLFGVPALPFLPCNIIQFKRESKDY